MYINPRIELDFVESNTTAVVPASGILKDSITIDRQLLNSLKSSSSTASFTLVREPLFDSLGHLTTTGHLVSDVGDIVVRIYDGTTPVFTGYVQKYSTWQLSNVGLRDLQVNVNDMGTVLLKSPYNRNVLKGTLLDCVSLLCDIGGIVLADPMVELPDDFEVLRRTDPTETIGSILSDLLLETGWCYSFDERGQLFLQPINLDENTTPSKTLWSATSDDMEEGDGYLFSKGSNAISIQRGVEVLQQATVDFTTTKEVEDLPVYSQTNVVVNEGCWWDGENHIAEALDQSFYPTLGTPQTYDQGIVTIVPLSNLQDEVRGIRFSWTQTCGTGAVSFGTKGSLDFFLSYVQDPTSAQDRANAWVNRRSRLYTFVVNKSAMETSHTGYFTNELISVASGHDLSDCNCLVIRNSSTFTQSHVSDLIVSGAYGSTSSSDDIIIGGGVVLTNLKSSSELLYVDQSTFTFSHQQDSGDPVRLVKMEPSEADNLTLEVLIDNSNNQGTQAVFGELSARATATVVDSEHNLVHSSTVGEVYSPSTPSYQFQAKYIHDRRLAEPLAMNLNKYWAFCQNLYSFYTDSDLELGEVIHIRDNLYSTISIDLVVVRKVTNLNLNGSTRRVNQYQGYALSEIHSTELRSSVGTSNATPYGNSKSLVFKGEWNEDTVYRNTDEVQDIVVHNGSSWACLVGNVGQEPSEESEYWSIVAQAGGNGVYTQYSLSSSESTYIGDDEWHEDVSDMYRHNLYVWKRLCSDLEDGTTVYGTPEYDWRLTLTYQSQVECLLVPVSYTYRVDRREDDSEVTEIPFIITNRGWDVSSWSVTTEASEVDIDVEAKTMTIPVSTAPQSFDVVLQGYDEDLEAIDGCNYILTFNAVDETLDQRYIGVYSSGDDLPSSYLSKKLVDGDCCLVGVSEDDVQTYVPYVYRDSWRPLEDDDEDWARVMALCQSEALELLQDSPQGLGASQFSYFRNIIAKNVTADLISATTLERNYKEDPTTGAPISGYRIDATTSSIRSANSVFGNCKLVGDEAVLDTPSLTTSNATTGSETHQGGSSGDSPWYDYEENTLPSYSSWYSATGTYNGNTVSAFRASMNSQMEVYSNSGIRQSGDYVELVVPIPCNGNYSISYQGFRSYTQSIITFGIKTWSTGGIEVYDSNGTLVYSDGRQAKNVGVRSFTVGLHKGDCKIRLLKSQFSENLHSGSVTVLDNIGQKGFALLTGAFQPVISGWSKSTVSNLRIGSTSYSYTPKYNWNGKVYKGQSLTTEGALSSIDGSTSTLTVGSDTLDGYTNLVWNEGSIRFGWNDGSTYTLSTETFLTGYSFSFETMSKTGYVEVTDLLPKNPSVTDIGKNGERFGTIFLINEPQWSSQRQYKKDIEDFDEYALETILGTSVKTFRMKTDADDAPKRLGFIADDTNHWMSQEHQGVSTSGCIGMLIKAIQEMQAEIDSLKEELRKK